jgi:hypothetical protein
LDEAAVSEIPKMTTQIIKNLLALEKALSTPPKTVRAVRELGALYEKNSRALLSLPPPELPLAELRRLLFAKDISFQFTIYESVRMGAQRTGCSHRGREGVRSARYRATRTVASF